MMCRSTSPISLLVSMQFNPNYLITLTEHMVKHSDVIILMFREFMFFFVFLDDPYTTDTNCQ